MLDKMNQTVIDVDYLETLEAAKNALHQLVQKIESNDDDGYEFIINLNASEKESAVDALTDALNKSTH